MYSVQCAVDIVVCYRWQDISNATSCREVKYMYVVRDLLGV